MIDQTTLKVGDVVWAPSPLWLWPKPRCVAAKTITAVTPKTLRVRSNDGQFPQTLRRDDLPPLFATEAEAFDWCRGDVLRTAKERVERARAELDYAATDLRLLESLVEADNDVRSWRRSEDKAREVSP